MSLPASDPFLPFEPEPVRKWKPRAFAPPRNGGLGAFIGEMIRMIERGEKQRVKDMNPQIVAKHYGTSPELIEAYRDFQLGGK